MNVIVYINHKSEVAMVHDSTCSCLSNKMNKESCEEYRDFIDFKEVKKWMHDLLNVLVDGRKTVLLAY